MTDLIALVGSTQVLALIMVAVVVEATLLIVWHRLTGRGPRPSLVLSFLGAGLAFLAALHQMRAHGAPTGAFIGALTLALVFHVWHLVLLSRR